MKKSETSNVLQLRFLDDFIFFQVLRKFSQAAGRDFMLSIL